MNKIAVFADFDLTLTEEYQQIPLVNHYLDKYKNYYNSKNILEKFRKYDKDFIFEKPDDFFSILAVKRKSILENDPTARIQNGVTWLGQLIEDQSPGLPLEGVTMKDLYELGKKVRMATGTLECFIELKKKWKKQNIDIKVYVVSVGLKTLIQGAIDGYIEQHNLKENPIDGIYAGEISPNPFNNNKLETISVIEDYSKTEIAYEISKGGQSNRDKKISRGEYVIPHNKFIVLGDGFSDIPMFRFFRKKGGICFMVYEKGSMKSYMKARQNAFDNVDYLVERDYTPNKENPLWNYINEAVDKLSYKKCKHSEISLYNYKWSKKLSKSEEKEIIEHLTTCQEHNLCYNLTYAVPRN